MGIGMLTYLGEVDWHQETEIYKSLNDKVEMNHFNVIKMKSSKGHLEVSETKSF